MPTVRSAAPSHALRGLSLLLAVPVTVAVLLPGVASATTSPTSTTTTLSPGSTRMAYNSVTTLTAKLTNSSTGSALNGPIAFWHRTSSTAKWGRVTTVNTNRGVAHYSYRAVRAEQWRAVFSGNTGFARSASAIGYISVTAASTSFGSRAVTEASRHAGAPYQWGAEGPTRFDCSGFTRYVFGRLGKSLPHNSSQQYGVVRHVSKSSMRIGDLIFIYDGGSIHHVGIYAGSGYMWHEPKSGDHVRKAKIWTSAYYVGRVG